MKNILKILTIDEYSITPKYRQLANGFIQAIKNGQIVKGDMLPSINDLSFALEISRKSIERAYNELKKIGIVGTVPGKGCFVLNADFKNPLKILLLFNKLSTHKKIIYDSFVASLGEMAAIDFYVYNNDPYLFKRILAEKVHDDYNKFVIVPYFTDNTDESYKLIDTLPKEKLVIMDKLIPGISGSFGAIYEDFENDLYGALIKLIQQLSKYKTLKIIYPRGTYYSEGIVHGFENFCMDYAFDFEVLPDLDHEFIKPGTAYINIAEDDLITLIRKIKQTDHVIGTDVGLISYNETDIKEIILNGITTISTDFKALGTKTAEIVLNNAKTHQAIPFNVIIRKSL
jgi:DNA-binding transcriptional regulator YhcF (GntR family)